MRVPHLFLALTACSGCAIAGDARGAIIYVDIEDRFTERLPVNLDLNQDGATDFFAFRTEDVGVSVAGVNDNGVQKLTPTSAFISFLVAGTVIDDRGPFGGSGLLAQVFCEEGGCAWFGPFTQVNEPGFVGVEFLIDEMTHFGWIQIGVSRINGVARIFDFAYESQPGVPIVAGKVPAPGGGVALLAGMLALGRRRR